MFESLKKKFSRTSEKLEEELIEEAEKEDNLQEESGKKFSFFSFGRKKEEKVEKIFDRKRALCYTIRARIHTSQDAGGAVIPNGLPQADEMGWRKKPRRKQKWQ